MPESAAFKITALLFPGFELLDIYGPLELFGLLGQRVAIQVVAPERGSVESSVSVRGYADNVMEDATDGDLLLIPGGRGVRPLVKDAAFLRRFDRLCAGHKRIGTICTGSALLAKTGRLDRRPATSNKLALDWVRRQGPDVDWKHQARWVDADPLWTASGVSAGMDMALAMIARIWDTETAQKVARHAEYSPHADPDIDPFAASHDA